jgi:hypothetical protein
MDCREFRELLGDEIDGRLAPADAARLAAHVASCAACAEERRDLASLRAAFRAMPRPPVPDGFRAQVLERLPSGRVIRFPRALGWMVAAAAVGVVAVTLFHRGGAGGPEFEVANAPAAATHRAADADDGFARKSGDLKGVDGTKESSKDVLVVREAAEAEKKSPGTLLDRADGAGAKLGKQDDSAAAPPAAPAPVPADASRAPAPQEPPPSAFAARALAESVRYVVFRDDASARRFAASLAEPDLDAAKDKGAAAEAAPTAKTAERAPSRTETAGEDEADRRARDLVEEASFTERRVVARAVVPASMTERDVDAALVAAGGRAIQAADTERFVALLDAPADAEAAKPKASPSPEARAPSDPAPAGATASTTAPGAPKADGAAEGRGKGAPDSGGGGGSGGEVKAERESEETRSRQQSRRVIVIVVLGPAPAPGGGK